MHRRVCCAPKGDGTEAAAAAAEDGVEDGVWSGPGVDGDRTGHSSISGTVRCCIQNAAQHATRRTASGGNG